MKNLQDGSLVRLVQVTDVTSSNEIETQAPALPTLPSLPSLPSPAEVRLAEAESKLTQLAEKLEHAEVWLGTTELGNQVTAVETRLDALEDRGLEHRIDRLEGDMPDTDELVQSYELDDYVKREDIDLDDVPTKDDVREMVDEAVETQVTAVTKSLVSIILEHCPGVADEIGKQYMLEREHIIESNKAEVEHRISFPSNERLAVDLCND